MAQIPMRHVLDLPELPPDHRLQAVLGAALRASRSPGPSVTDGVLWDAAFHDLDRCGAYQALSAPDQTRVLRAASTTLVGEAWWIERSGLAFTAKMSLLASSHEARMLYSLFAADEARHLHAVGAWVPEPPAPTAFHTLLADAIATAPRAALVLVVQVVLEGWGLKHYRAMADATLDPALATVLRGILDDETRHHGSGALMLSEAPLSADDQAAAIAILADFLAMVRVGPVGLLEALTAATGPLSPTARADVLHDLDAVGHAQRRLDLLSKLLDRPHARSVRDALAERGLFTPEVAA